MIYLIDKICYFIDKFSTREHFMRCIASFIIGIAGYQSLTTGQVGDHWLLLVGTVMGYYFKNSHTADEKNVSTHDKGEDK